MERYIPGVTPDRRKSEKPDLAGQFLSWLGLGAWLLFFLMLIMGNRARPELKTSLEAKYDIATRNGWDPDTARVLFYLMVIGLMISLTGTYLRKARTRRRTDSQFYSILLIGIVSAVGIVYYLFMIGK